MLTVALAGLVLNKVITIEEAEQIRRELGDEKVPGTVKETVDRINEVIIKIRNSKKL